MRILERFKMLPIFLTVFIDLLGVTIVLPILAPLFFDPNYRIFPDGFASEHKTLVLGMLLAIFPLAQFFAAPVIGAISDRAGRRKVLIVSLIGTAIGYFLFAQGIILENIWLLFLARAIDGATGGNIAIIYSAIADVSHGDEKTKNFGLVGVAFGLGFILGPFIGGYLSNSTVVSWFNYATPFWVQCILAVLNIFFVVFFFPETLKKTLKSKISALSGVENFARMFKKSNIRVLLIMHLILMFAFNLFVQFFSLFLLAKYNLQTEQIGTLFAYLGVWIAVTQGILIRFISNRYTPSKVLVVNILLMFIGMLAIILPFQRVGLYIFMPVLAVSWGIIQPHITSLISSLSPEDTQGEVMGVIQSNNSLSQIIPPIIDGAVFALSPNLPILISAGLIMAAWILFVFLYKKNSVEEIAYKFHEKYLGRTSK